MSFINKKNIDLGPISMMNADDDLSLTDSQIDVRAKPCWCSGSFKIHCRIDTFSALRSAASTST